MDFFQRTGKMALGSRLRRLSEMITAEAAELYALYGVELRPKWFPVFYALSHARERTITEIAEHIGHSHPSVVKIVREMTRAGVVAVKASAADGRKTVVALTRKGEALTRTIQDQYVDVERAIERALEGTRHNLWDAIGEWENLLEEKSLVGRVLDERKRREPGKVRIVPYARRFRAAFKALNEEWITKYFALEPADRKALGAPEKNILRPGGEILVALLDDEPVGVCALLKMDATTFELAKMAVSPRAQGKGIGTLLGEAAIQRAKAAGADRLYLESNTRLEPAIALYRKLGFEEIARRPSPYARSNIQMELRVT